MNKLCFSIVATLLACNLLAAPFQKLPYTIKQPNGTLIECFVSGDEFFNWIHDNDGYPIIKGSDNYYYYAVLSGETFVASQFIVGEHLPNSVGIVKMQDIDNNIIRKKIDEARKALEIPEKPVLNPSRDQRNTLHTGTINNIVIYIRFAGESDFQTPRLTYDNRLNQPTGFSLKAYYWETSYNQLTINSTHYPPVEDPATQNFSYQDSHPRSYFQPYHETNNPNGYKSGQRTQREHQLLVDAVNWINANHPIPADLNIDTDNDGYVDNVCFMIKGNSGVWSDLLWAHRWSLYSYTVRINGKRVWDYTFQPENQVGVTTLCHEMFHVLGAPDLYHYNNGTNLHPVGKWCLMQNGSGHMLTYMKWKYAQQQWVTNIPEITESGQYTLYPTTQQTNNCYKIATPYSQKEFYMVEYRKRSGQFESTLPGQGLIVYRINTRFNGNADYDGITRFDEVYVYRPGGTTTTNGSVNAAPYSANSGRTAINDNTNPSGFLCDGTLGGLNIFDVSEIGDSISFNVSFDPLPFVELVINPQPEEGGNPTGAGSYEAGTVVELQANPNQGWKFVAWTKKSNALLTTQPSYSYAMGFENDTINAVYAEETYVDEIENQFVIYPNPANNLLYISTLTDIRQIVIYDISGKVLMNISSRDALRQIDISSLKSGVYLIEVYDSNKMSKTINKFIKL